MGDAILDIVIDQLDYLQNGNFNDFTRCFDRAIECFGFNINIFDQRKLRNIAFHFLRTTGYVESVSGAKSTEWTVPQSALVQVGIDKYAVHGNRAFQRKIQTVFGGGSMEIVESNERFAALPSGIRLFPTLILVKGNSAEITNLARLEAINIVSGAQSRLFSVLPRIQDVESRTMVPLESVPTIDPDAGEYFHMEKMDWEPFHYLVPDLAGLYRRKHRFHPPDYILFAPKERLSNAFFRILDPEWSLLLTFWKAQANIAIEYSRASSSVSFPAWVRLPTLIERCLRSGTLTAPTNKAGKRVYFGIEEKSAWKLALACPFFKLELR